MLQLEIPFISITEYSRPSEVSRGRSRFFHGQVPFLLYTGRCYFYERLKIRGGRNAVFYGIPDDANGFKSVVESLEEINDKSATAAEKNITQPLPSPSVLTLFNKFEEFALERIVGMEHSKRMINGGKNTFLFT